jgi:hypothetical protein
LRVLAGRVKDANQARRLLAVAAVYEGMDREEAARIGGMDRQTLRDWVHRFNTHGPQAARASSEVVSGAEGGVARACGGRARSADGWGGALALRRLEAGSRGALRRRSIGSEAWAYS